MEKEVEKKESGKILIIVLVLIIIGLASFIVYDKVLKNNNNQNKETKEEIQENKKDDKEEKEENKIYGYLAIFDEETSRILELNSNGDNKELANKNGRIYGFRISHNNLYYYIQGDKETAYYIDLSSTKKESIELISGKDVVDYYFDSNDKYLFATSIKGVNRYDLESKNSTNMLSNIRTSEVFIANNKIYVAGQKIINSYNVSEEESYYTANFDGENIEEITKIEFEKTKDGLNNIEEINSYNEQMFIYNNKKVMLSSDMKEILYDNETIYKADTNKKLQLLYSEERETIGFMEYSFDGESTKNQKYYIYDIENKEVKETSKEKLYNFSLIVTESN